MADPLDIDTLNTAAAEAASRGDAATAAALLGRALDLQVRALGPEHRDLTPTLSNLAMMLEQQGDTAEAERCYRRAYAVARRGALPDDPLVAASRANLVAFLQASGIANPMVDEPAPVPAADGDSPTPALRAEPVLVAVPPATVSAPPTPPPPVATTSPPRRERPRTVSPVAATRATPDPAPTTPTASAQRSPTITAPVAKTGANGRGRFGVAIAAGALAAAVAGWLLIGRQQPDTGQEAPPVSAPVQVEPALPAPRSDAPAGTAAGTTSPPPAPAPVDASPSPRSEEPPSRAPQVAARDGAGGDAAARQGEGTTITVDGRLCTALARGGGVWRCDPAGDSTAADAVYYYSRVRSSRDVVVRHRWSHDGEVVRTVPLEVRANPQDGFRTFSRQNLSGRRGAWEVALLAPDGTVVETQRITSGTRK